MKYLCFMISSSSSFSFSFSFSISSGVSRISSTGGIRGVRGAAAARGGALRGGGLAGAEAVAARARAQRRRGGGQRAIGRARHVPPLAHQLVPDRQLALLGRRRLVGIEARRPPAGARA